ncbi:MAG: tetratricopeptide repeat protein [Fidelibacterota bacterium]
MTEPDSLLTPLCQFIDSGQLEEAETYVAELSAGEAPPAEFWIRAGKIFKDSPRPVLALKTYNQGLKLYPRYLPIYMELADYFIENKEYEQAERSLLIANDLIPNNGMIEGKLGQNFLKSGNYEACIRWTTSAIQHQPDVPDLYNILGDAHLRLGQLDEARMILEKGLSLAPDFPRLLNTLASVFALEGDYIRSNEILDRALALEPEFAQAHVKHSVNLLTMGKLQSGWAEYEYRRALPAIRNPDQGCPEWQGEGIAGKTILIWTEQGLGDTIQYFRYLYRMKALGVKIILECRPVLYPLFEGHPVLDSILLRNGERPPIDLHCSIMSLPKYFERNFDDRRIHVPYLDPREDTGPQLKEFIQKLDSSNCFKVGLTWAGNPDNKNDANRSIPVQLLARLLDLRSIQFVNLQFDRQGTSADIDELPDPTPLIHNFAETAAVLKHLDLVISVDTSMCHLAGALGRPVWTLLPWNPDFRWGLDTEETDYYPTMRLFRQPTRNDWDSVLNRVTGQLNALAKGGK